MQLSTNVYRRGSRRRTASRLLAALFLVALGAHSASAQDWKLVWSDEFEGARNAAVDKAKWKLEVGGGGWGNNERQYYTKKNKNAYLDGAGSLVIEAKKTKRNQKLSCWYGRCEYTSARLVTKGKFDVTYGRIEARMKIPQGQGIWPAYWMLGSNIVEAGWPASGEIDIMENIGREPTTVHGTIHGPGYSGGNGIGAAYEHPEGAKFADDYHVYAIEWEPNVIRWYVDDALYATKTPADLPNGARWVYDHPFFLLLNVAVGGNWPGYPDATSQFPQQMLVDYVRVYQRQP
jgi:beta-glucanase (GH16 family)